MTGYFEREAGNKSMMRLLSFLGFIIGSAVALWGLVLMSMLVLAIVDGSVAAQGGLGTILFVITAGLALAGGGEAMKVIQQKAEAKENHENHT